MSISPIVLVHGLIGHQSDPVILQAFASEALPQTRVIAPDLIGYGRHQSLGAGGWTLQEQAAHLRDEIKKVSDDRVHLVGHSVGGAVCALVAQHYPESVKSLTLVEGNFTLKDAFWSSQIAKMEDNDVEELLKGYRSNHQDWLKSSGVALSDWTSQLALSWLQNQSAFTVKEQARAVIEATKSSVYLEHLKDLFSSGLPNGLIAGARSAESWDVPNWANDLCSMRANIPNSGHLMMADCPVAYASVIVSMVHYFELPCQGEND